MGKTSKRFAELMKKHGLLELGWKYKFDQAKERFGLCNFENKFISISELICLLNEGVNFPAIEDTILHEIAHALTFNQYGATVKSHGKEWKRIAREIGCNANVFFSLDEIIVPETEFKYKCPECGYTYGRHRKMSSVKVLSCAICCNKHNHGKYSEKYKFILVE